ncbi:IMPACT family member YigZ [Pseudodesulfovibrio hydrargyri]|uniref:IMPACT family member YigZ n=1 Tax=Pseudodesulfovibrio hydrargyri TaxID=2125990 RepID=A0A1J5MVI7_9BACT|nr:YigZ family protein [Pseudodesulfovibrio hydrargyri]OIQ49804.1 IMPACT family member YigZ [Pseudodesulfovibrio hydrargyri]
MAERYPIPAAFHRVEQTIKRSRFMASMNHAPDMDSARAFVAAVKEEFPEATHNCWAFNAGPPGDTARVGLSDDGEPGGTAGKPMLGVLLHSGVGEIAVVVTRWFGGTKLGTGGLVRAYAGLVNLGLETLPLRDMIVTRRLGVSLPYPSVTLFKRLLPGFEAEVADEAFSDVAEFTVELPEEHVDGFARTVVELTGGRAEIHEK